MTAAERLRAYLLRNRLTQRAFAQESGLSEPFVCQLISGVRRPSITKASHLEDITGIPVRAWTVTEDTETANTNGGRRAKR